jgi:hypothetical protein
VFYLDVVYVLQWFSSVFKYFFQMFQTHVSTVDILWLSAHGWPIGPYRLSMGRLVNPPIRVRWPVMSGLVVGPVGYWPADRVLSAPKLYNSMLYLQLFI